MNGELTPFIEHTPKGAHRAHLMVQGIHCAGCVAHIERGLQSHPGVTHARVNLTTRRLMLEWEPRRTTLPRLMQAAEKLGYPLQPYRPETIETADTATQRRLLLCLAVAGFASMNVMLLSVSLWAGWAEMGPGTRGLMQWFSALVTLPAVAYAGVPFFESAAGALRRGRLNMDVPISLAVILTTGLSLFDTLAQYGETYFESAAMLLFFLLAGRYLDARARARTRSAAEQLLLLRQSTARVVAGGKIKTLAASALRVGQVLLCAAGERLPVDGVVLQGTSAADTSLLTGESLPRTLKPGMSVCAGIINLQNPIRLRITTIGKNTTLAQLAQLVEQATEVKNRYTRLADVVARRYAPVVHLLALLTFGGWYLGAGTGLHDSLLHAVAVLIVTCPCALALAVPAVQVAVVSRLLRQGIILKNPEALERLPLVRAVVFDKTGTLTTGRLTLVNRPAPADLKLAARLAASSRHPLSQALVAASGPAASQTPLNGVKEIAGKGLRRGGTRLGSAAFCNLKPSALPAGHSALFMVRPGHKPARFLFADTLRPDAAQTVARFARAGLEVWLLSGDEPGAVAAVARQVGLENSALGGQSPAQKQAFLRRLKNRGAGVLMCGDGINDAPSLAVADAGLTFASASHIAQAGADIIVQSDRLDAAWQVYRAALAARRAVKLNFAVSFGYNVVTVPLAMAGYITPLWAAAAMSGSSLMVVANALRLSRKGGA